MKRLRGRSPRRRRELLERVEERVTRFAQAGEPDAVLAPAADDEARNLLAVVGWDPETGGSELDAEAVLAVAWLYWLRADARERVGEDPEPEVTTAVALFTPLHAVDPDLLPPTLRGLLDTDGLPAGDPGVLRYREFLQSRDPAVLEDAVRLLRDAVLDSVESDTALPRRLSNLAAALRERHLLSPGHDDIDAAVDAARRAVVLSALDDPERPARLTNLGSALLTRAEAGGPDDDLDAAVDALQDAVDGAADNPQRPVFLANLAAALSTRFELHGVLTDADAAVAAARDAVAAGPAEAEERSAALSTLGLALRERHEATGSPDDLDEAVTVGRAAVDAADGEPSALANLSSALLARYELRLDHAELAQAEQTARAALAASVEGDSLDAMCRANLSTVLQARFDVTGEPEVLDEAVELARIAAAGSSRHTAPHMVMLSSALRTRYEAAGRIDDLDDALAAGRRVLDLLGPDHPLRCRALLATALVGQTRAALHTSAAALEDALDAARAAFAAAPAGRSEQVGVRATLASVLQDRFAAQGRADDLSETIDLLRDAVHLATGTIDHALCLSSLSAALLTRFEADGRPGDVHDAVTAGRAAVAATPARSWQRPVRLVNLAAALRTRYEALGAVDDLHEAVAHAREAVASTPDGSPARGGHLSALSGALQTRWIGLRDGADLDQAVDVARAAVRASGPADQRLPGRLSNLASALQARAAADDRRAPADLDEAAEVARRAVDAAVAGSLDQAAMLSNLGFTLWSRHRVGGDPRDLDDAVDAGRHAVDQTPRFHPDRTTYLHNLAVALADRHQRSEQRDDLRAALTCYEQAAAITSAPPVRRLLAARSAGQLAASLQLADVAVADLADAVALLPVAAWPGLDRASQELHVAGAQGLAGEAAAWALTDGRPVAAVELVELGRAVLWAHTLDARSAPASLHAVAPDLADRLTELATARNRPGGGQPTRSGPDSRRDRT